MDEQTVETGAGGASCGVSWASASVAAQALARETDAKPRRDRCSPSVIVTGVRDGALSNLHMIWPVRRACDLGQPSRFSLLHRLPGSSALSHARKAATQENSRMQPGGCGQTAAMLRASSLGHGCMVRRLLARACYRVPRSL